MAEPEQPDGAVADDRVRLVGALVALVVGAAGMVIYPRPHSLWLASVILVIVSISLLAWLALREFRRDR
jgi:hypothetical protein